MDIDFESSEEPGQMPQISTEIDRHSKHLSNHELDHVNKIYYDEKNKNKKKNLLDLTINEIVENTIKFFINFNNDFNEILYEYEMEFQNEENEEEKLNQFKIYLYALVRYVSIKDNLFYFGVTLIILSIILYFINIT